MTPDPAQRGRAGPPAPLMDELQLLWLLPVSSGQAEIQTQLQHRRLFRCDAALKVRKICLDGEKRAGRRRLTERQEEIQRRETDSAEAARQRPPGRFPEMNINNISSHNRSRDQRDHLHCQAASY